MEHSGIFAATMSKTNVRYVHRITKYHVSRITLCLAQASPNQSY